jgi:hypothetical protein
MKNPGRLSEGDSCRRKFEKDIQMKDIDRISGVIFFFLGLGICLKSLTYPIESLKTPGAGLFPLFISIIMMSLSAVLAIQTFLQKDKELIKVSFSPAKGAAQRVLLGFVALLTFRYLFPLVGFAFSIFILTFFLAKSLGQYSWKFSIFFSMLTALMAYYLFQVWLSIPMPQGSLGI